MGAEKETGKNKKENIETEENNQEQNDLQKQDTVREQNTVQEISKRGTGARSCAWIRRYLGICSVRQILIWRGLSPV